MDKASTSKTPDTSKPPVDFQVPTTSKAAYEYSKPSTSQVTYITKKSNTNSDPYKIFKKTTVKTKNIAVAETVSDTDKMKSSSDTTNTLGTIETVVEGDVSNIVYSEPEKPLFGSLSSIVISDVVGAADASVIKALSVDHKPAEKIQIKIADDSTSFISSSLDEQNDVDDPIETDECVDLIDPFDGHRASEKERAMEMSQATACSNEVLEDVVTISEEGANYSGHLLRIQDIEMKLPCMMCRRSKIVKYNCLYEGQTLYVCQDECYRKLVENAENVTLLEPFSKFYASPLVSPHYKHLRQCAQCARGIISSMGVCSWEAMDFCKESCLFRFQKKLSAACAECSKIVQYAQQGKYCVRFGCIIRQFCSSTCLEARKRKIRICSYCQKSIQRAKSLVGGKYFCNDICKGMYENMQDPRRPPFLINPDDACCFVCKEAKAVQIEFDYHCSSYYFCSSKCFTVFRFIQNCENLPKKCHTCAKYALQQYLEKHALHYDNMMHYFCSESCQHIYIITHRRVVPCLWCKVKKYNFDMIQKDDFYGNMIYTCSLNCLNQLVATCEVVLANQKTCHMCSKATGVYDMKLANGTSHMFCSNHCITMYQTQFSHVMLPQKRTRGRGRHLIPDKPSPLPVISSVCSLAPVVKKLIVVESPELPDIRNVGTMASVIKSDIGTQVEKEMVDVELQVNLQKQEAPFKSVLVPIYVPFPFATWRAPVPVPLPFPMVIPTPFLLPLTKKLSNKIMKDVKKVPIKAPTDPFEAELLMMAELVAAEKKESPQVASEDDDDVEDAAEGSYSPEEAENSHHAFGEDMLQMALNMASDYDEPAVDLEGALAATTITPTQAAADVADNSEETQQGGSRPQLRGRRRGTTRTRYAMRKTRRSMAEPPVEVTPEEEPVPQNLEPVEKPDAHLCLKYTFGVNAWKQWVASKNIDIERSSQRLKTIKSELLQLTSDELNFSLCMFVDEVRKPNGSEYAPDTIYYLCLGIQQYLYESGRIDNIFCDPYYEKFTEVLDKICQKFAALYNDSHYIVTRVEEEHLWESKQLGAHSPHVLLSTLMFFNTKHFNLVNADEHMQLSFSHIMKHWKRNPNQPGASKQPPGSRNVLLRFYPPQQSLDGNSRKKKVYEQEENEENPLRCPVKLYEFYLSKCPESVKTRNDVFYLLPERSCVPDSPVWYSTMALDRVALEKMLHRVKMVKEINVALLTN